MIKLTANNDGVTFAVRVQPRASKSAITGELDGALKIRLAAPPVDGEANEELIRFLAKLFDVPRARVSIISGPTSKNKIVKISGISSNEVEQALNGKMGK
ncbi:MAG: DUF167 domain-containing protein [Acidobacteria bacterium]|nr:DUF167 domain-containing protein [Acidobacteriota bacterium]